MGIPVLGPGPLQIYLVSWRRTVSTNESGGRGKPDTWMLQVKRSQRTFSESKNPDVRVDRREHRVKPILVHPAAAACKLESKVLIRKENAIGNRSKNRFQNRFQNWFQSRYELPALYSEPRASLLGRSWYLRWTQVHLIYRIELPDLVVLYYCEGTAYHKGRQRHTVVYSTV